MSFIEVYAVAGLVILGLMAALWIVSLLLRNASIVDIFWGPGFVLSAWVFFALTPDGYLPRKLLVVVLASIWGLRLGLHILVRNWGKPEDFRYQVWRKEEGASWWWRSFIKVFLLQGVLLWIISIPLLAAQFGPWPAALTILDALAVAVWAYGFFFEAVGDWQLSRFRANPANKGKLFTGGVWRYSRHPNYFGDAAQWWGYFLLAAATGAWWTVYSPLIMTGLLLKVSGVALLEKTLKSSKPGYEEYIATTSSFIPLPPRRKS
jgi:steroid 5-alpha reductase family enzyme